MIVEEIKLINVYKEMNGNIFDVAAEFRVSVQTIMASLKKYKIDFVKPKHIYSDLKRTGFSKFQRSLLIGSTLGDGHLEKRGHLKNALFRTEHSVKQIEWLKWKYDNLKPFTTSNIWTRDRGRKALMPDGHGKKKLYNISNVVSMSTNTHPYLTILHNEFYKNRKKVVPFDFLKEEFDLVSMAVLIGDDGSLGANGLIICTDSFMKKEVLFLMDLFKNFFSGKITITINKNDFRIRLCSVHKEDCFIQELYKILPKCMHYKLPPVLNEHQAATHNE